MSRSDRQPSSDLVDGLVLSWSGSGTQAPQRDVIEVAGRQVSTGRRPQADVLEHAAGHPGDVAQVPVGPSRRHETECGAADWVRHG